MANNRTLNWKDFSYLAAACEIMQSRVLLTKDQHRKASATARMYLSLESNDEPTNQFLIDRYKKYRELNFSYYREIFQCAHTSQFSYLSDFCGLTFEEGYVFVENIRNRIRNYPLDFNYSVDAEPYFNYLRTFLGITKNLNPVSTALVSANQPTILQKIYLFFYPPRELPNEIWDMIFFYSSFNELKTLRCVNHNFNNLVNIVPITDHFIETGVFVIAVNELVKREKTIAAFTYPQLLNRLNRQITPIEKEDVMMASRDHASYWRLNGEIFREWTGKPLTYDSNSVAWSMSHFNISTWLIIGGTIAGVGGAALSLLVSLGGIGTVGFLAALCAIPGAPFVLLCIAALALMVVAGAMIYKAVVHDKIVNETTKSRAIGATAVGFFKQVESSVKSSVTIEEIKEEDLQLPAPAAADGTGTAVTIARPTVTNPNP